MVRICEDLLWAKHTQAGSTSFVLVSPEGGNTAITPILLMKKVKFKVLSNCPQVRLDLARGSWRN